MNLRRFRRRLLALYASWREHRDDLWAGAEALVISTVDFASSSSTSPSPSPSAASNAAAVSKRHLPKSLAFYQWLLGNNRPESVVVFRPESICIVSVFDRKVSLRVEYKEEVRAAVGAELILYSVGRDSREKATLDAVVQTVFSLSELEGFPINGDSLVIGCIGEETGKVTVSAVVDRGRSKGRPPELIWRDATKGFLRLLRIMDGDEEVKEEDGAKEENEHESEEVNAEVASAYEAKNDTSADAGLADTGTGAGASAGLADTGTGAGAAAIPSEDAARNGDSEEKKWRNIEDWYANVLPETEEDWVIVEDAEWNDSEEFIMIL